MHMRAHELNLRATQSTHARVCNTKFRLPRTIHCILITLAGQYQEANRCIFRRIHRTWRMLYLGEEAKRSPYLRIENKLLWYGPEPDTEPSWLLAHRLGVVQTISTLLVVGLVGHDAIYHFARVIACHKYQSVVFPNTHRLWCDGTVNHKFECSAVPWIKKGSLTYNDSRRTPSSASGCIPCRQPHRAIGTSTFSLVVRQISLMPRRVQNWIKSIRSHKQVCATSVSSHQ